MEDKPEHRVEHLKMVQAVIARLSNLGARVKTWTITLVGAVFVYAAATGTQDIVIVAAGLVLVVLLGLLDARYLFVETCYRELHKAIASGKPVKPFDMDYRPYVRSARSIGWVAQSRTVLGFYVPVFAMVVILGTLEV